MSHGDANREQLVAMAVVDSQVDPFDLDALAVSDRFRLFGFTRRDDYLAYLWVLRAMDRLRGAHVAQAHTDDVAEVLAEFAAAHDTVPGNLASLRGRLDNLTDDGVLHRLEDASRAGSLARYRNRQSVYQFSELGHRAYTAVEGVLAARVQDANLSRLVFSDILRDMRGLAEANRAGDGAEIVRRLTSLDRVMEDMARRSARFHLTLGDMTRSTDASPETFLRYKHALLAHMSDFVAELDRYLPRLALAVAEVESTGIGTLLNRAAEADERPLMQYDDVLGDWRRRWAAVRAWFSADGEGSRAAELAAATRAGVSSVIALLRQITEAQRGGVNRATPLPHLAAQIFEIGGTGEIGLETKGPDGDLVGIGGGEGIEGPLFDGDPLAAEFGELVANEIDPGRGNLQLHFYIVVFHRPCLSEEGGQKQQDR